MFNSEAGIYHRDPNVISEGERKSGVRSIDEHSSRRERSPNRTTTKTSTSGKTMGTAVTAAVVTTLFLSSNLFGFVDPLGKEIQKNKPVYSKGSSSRAYQPECSTNLTSQHSGSKQMESMDREKRKGKQLPKRPEFSIASSLEKSRIPTKTRVEDGLTVGLDYSPIDYDKETADLFAYAKENGIDLESLLDRASRVFEDRKDTTNETEAS